MNNKVMKTDDAPFAKFAEVFVTLKNNLPTVNMKYSARHRIFAVKEINYNFNIYPFCGDNRKGVIRTPILRDGFPFSLC